MSSGCVHGVVSVAAGIAAGSAMFYATGNASCAVAVCAGCLAGVIISPDLDEGNPTTSHYQVRRGLGIFFAAIWWLLWQPYVLLMNRHRSFLSHFPIISTAGRVGYLGAIMIPVVWGVNYLGALPSINKLIDSVVWTGYVLQPLWESIRILLPTKIEIPGVGMWIGFLIAAAVIAVMSLFMRIDFPEGTQKVIFWVMVGVIVVIGALWVWLTHTTGEELASVIPIGAWAFAGLSLSDTMHSLFDWYITIYI
jgi:uncharacterized metal-binding protein